MINYVEVAKGMYLAQQEIPKELSKPFKSQINHIWIYDRSGSMSWVLPNLAKDLILRAREIPEGDTITLGWFSGEGSFNFMLKGYKVTDKRDYKILEETINKNKHSMGCTCFSEILADTENVVKDLGAISKNFAMCFFTDGYPVVSNYTREIDQINKAIDKIAGKVTSSLLVGYGNYYNKELMSNMASRLGGALCHSTDLPQFAVSLQEFVEGSRGSTKNIVEISDDLDWGEIGIPFSINKKVINVYEPKDGAVNFSRSDNGTAVDTLYFITEMPPKGTEVKVDSSEEMVKAAYAAAYILTQRTKTDKALEVLAKLGDVALIDAVSNAFTNAEYGAAEDKIRLAMAMPSKRFAKGKNTKYLPAADAFCLLDLMDILMQDDEAYFYPMHPDFSYNRVGVASKTKDGYPEFEADKKSKCSISQLTWNKTKLNLSLLAKINGSIELKKGHEKHGFSKNYPTWVFRNYTLVKDGFLNVPRLPVEVSSVTLKKLSKIDGLVVRMGSPAHDPVLLDLTVIPVINRVIADGKTSAKKLCENSLQELSLQAELKVLRYYKDKLEEDVGTVKTSLSVEQEKFLEDNGIGKNGFSPPSEKEQAEDFYLCKEFEIKVKGFSSLPKVEEVQDKMLKGKLNGPGELMAPMVKWYDGLKQKDSVKITLVQEKIQEKTSELLKVRSGIQRTKFAIILGKRWFDEFTSRENNVLTVDGKECTISLREVKVEV